LVLLMLWSDHHSGTSNAEAIYFEIGMIVDLYDKHRHPQGRWYW